MSDWKFIDRTAFLAEQLTPVLKDRRVLIGVTGSIAAFKAIDLIRLLKKCGAQVRVAVTENALRFVTKTTLETLSGEPVLSSLWDGPAGTHHISTARWAEAVLVAPATANTLAKISLGLCDDLLTTEILAFKGPLLVAPAMNPAMFEAAATQEHLKRLAQRGVTLVGPVVGGTACGEEGAGRMVEATELALALAEALIAPLRRAHGAKNRVVVSLGPTVSSLDPVRLLTNRSTGLMGASLCWEAFRRGFLVSAVAGPCPYGAPELLPPGARVTAVTTAQEMLAAVKGELASSAVAGFASTAAVLDWNVAKPSGEKLKKTPKTLPPSLSLKENPDILKTVAASRRRGQWALGFAAETGDLAVHGPAKLMKKGCDFLFANDVSSSAAGFGAAPNGGTLFSLAGKNTVRSFEAPLQSKSSLAQWIFSHIEGAAP